MAKKYKLAVANIVKVDIKVTISDEAGKSKKHDFELTCNRIGAEELAASFSKSSPKDFMLAQTVGWARQRLVMEDDDTPAEFCTDALDAMLDIQGLAMVVFQAYLKAAAATEKN